MKDLVVIGAGGFGRETIDTVRAGNEQRSQWNLLGVVDDSPTEVNLGRLDALGVPYIGGVDEMPADAAVAVGVGNPSIRRRLVAMIAQRGHSFPALVHPSAVIGSQFTYGDGLIVLAGVSIGANVGLGEHVHLNAHIVLGHDVQLADYVSVNPNATVSGECSIEEETLLGASSTVLQGLTVGCRVTIGAAACVTHSIPDGTVAVGIPAQPLQKGQSA